MLNLKFLVSIVLLLQLPFQVVKNNNNISSYNISYLGIDKGLSNNFVTSIYQDYKGFIWIGTYDGLNRYDGYNFEVYRNQPSDSSSLINNRIVSIFSQADKIWIGTKKGISIYDYLTGNFSPHYWFDPFSEDRKIIDAPINEIKGYEDTIYIATAGEGLMYQAKDYPDARRIPLNIKGKLTWDFHAQGIAFDKEGKMWVFIQGTGIALYDPVLKELQPAFSDILSGTRMVFDEKNNLWVGLDNGLLRYNIKDKSHYIFSQSVIRHKVKDLIYVPESKEIWAGTDGNGVVKYNVEEDIFETLQDDQSKLNTIGKSVYALYIDQDKRKWIGTLRGGINILTPENLRFKTIAKEKANGATNLVSDYILSFCEINKDSIWIGTDGDGVSLWDRSQNTFTNFTHNPNNLLSLPNNFVTSIIKTKKGYWFGTYGGGLSLFDFKNKTFKNYPLFNEKFNTLQQNVWVLYKDSKENLWVASSEGEGLFKYNELHDEFDFIDTGIDGIVSFIQDNNGNFWAGTFGDLIKLDLEGKKHQVFPIEYPVRTIKVLTNNKLLIGTEGGGLISFNTETFEKSIYTEADGLPSNSVLNILKDNQGYYWLSTYNGISKFDAENKKISNFFEGDGLQSNQFNYNAALKLSTGELLMGGIKGFNIIDTHVNSPAPKFPNILITGIKINNTPLSASGATAFGTTQLKLPFDRSMISIDFVGLEYDMPGNISYAYLLEGWDREWHYIGNSRVANYSKLTEGDYILKIKSTNADGAWNSKITTLPITILPPWYRSPLAYFLYFITLASIFIGIVFYQHKQTRLKYEVRLSRNMAKQEHELTEKKLNFFTNISHEFRSPLTMIINPLKEMIYGQEDEMDPGAIEVVYRNSRRLLSLVDQLLLFRKTESETGTLKIVRLDAISLGKEVFACFVHQAKSRNIQYEFFSDEKELWIYADRQKIEMALFNLISNALKFTNSQEGKVKVSIDKNAEEVCFMVSDNGQGINEADKSKVFDLFYQSDSNVKKKGFGIGLYLVKQFVEQHHGKVVCKDKIKGGTTFKIKLKLGKAHFTNLIISEDDSQNDLILKELLDEKEFESSEKEEELQVFNEIIKDKKTVLAIDDNPQIRKYIKKILSDTYVVSTAENADEALEIIKKHHPDLIISDVVMEGMNGVEFCKIIKEDKDLKHIPVILLTAGTSEDIKLKGVEVGADDYITKPFDKNYLKARIKGILKRQAAVQNHLLNTVTQNTVDQKLSEEDKRLLDHIIEIVENNMEEESFSIKMLALEVGMSHSLMYKKIKKITGKSVSEFVRFIRLRKVATLLITSNMQISKAASIAGFSDLKYFRKQFQQQYNMNPSQFQKKYKEGLMDKKYVLNESFWKST